MDGLCTLLCYDLICGTWHTPSCIDREHRAIPFLFFFSPAVAKHFLFGQGSCVFSLVLILTCCKIHHRPLSRVSVRYNWPHRHCSLNSGSSLIFSVQDRSIAVPLHFICSPVPLPTHAFLLTITCLETGRRHRGLRI